MRVHLQKHLQRNMLSDAESKTAVVWAGDREMGTCTMFGLVHVLELFNGEVCTFVNTLKITELSDCMAWCISRELLLKTIAAVTIKHGAGPVNNAHMSEVLGATGP